MAKRVGAPAAKGNRARGSKGQGDATPRRRKVPRVEPEEVREVAAAPGAATSDEPRDYTLRGLATAVTDIFRVDRGFADPAAVQRFRERYPVPVIAHPRLPPPPVPYRPTDDELRRARALVEFVGATLVGGWEAQWDLLRLVHETLRWGTRRTDAKYLRQAACVQVIENALQAWHCREPGHERVHVNVVEGLIDGLASYEPAYGRLKPEIVRAGLDETQPRVEVKKGGLGHKGPLRLAAVLTLDVGAFGFQQEPEKGYEEAIENVRDAFGGAEKRAAKARAQGRRKA